MVAYLLVCSSQENTHHQSVSILQSDTPHTLEKLSSMVCSMVHCCGAQHAHLTCLTSRPCVCPSTARHVTRNTMMVSKAGSRAACMQHPRNILGMPASWSLTHRVRTLSSATSTTIVASQEEQLQQYRDLIKWAKQHGMVEVVASSDLIASCHHHNAPTTQAHWRPLARCNYSAAHQESEGCLPLQYVPWERRCYTHITYITPPT